MRQTRTVRATRAQSRRRSGFAGGGTLKAKAMLKRLDAQRDSGAVKPT